MPRVAPHLSKLLSPRRLPSLVVVVAAVMDTLLEKKDENQTTAEEVAQFKIPCEIKYSWNEFCVHISSPLFDHPLNPWAHNREIIICAHKSRNYCHQSQGIVWDIFILQKKCITFLCGNWSMRGIQDFQCIFFIQSMHINVTLIFHFAKWETSYSASEAKLYIKTHSYFIYFFFFTAVDFRLVLLTL